MSEGFESANNSKSMAEYRVGDNDTRPWGEYIVTAVGVNGKGEEYCEKKITIKPGQILSLQSHDQRREYWRVTAGTLTVLLDGKRMELEEGRSVEIPLRGIHCMANLGNAPCVVFERQEGICREADIKRYVDAYGRAAAGGDDPKIAESVKVYQAILSEISKSKALPDGPRNGG